MPKDQVTPFSKSFSTFQPNTSELPKVVCGETSEKSQEVPKPKRSKKGK
jgi:hypothetical protein